MSFSRKVTLIVEYKCKIDTQRFLMQNNYCKYFGEPLIRDRITVRKKFNLKGESGS